MAGNYYCYDNPAALLSMLERQFSGDGTPEGDQFELYYEMMYSVYSLPNIVLPLIGGVLVDRVGVIFALNMCVLRLVDLRARRWGRVSAATYTSVWRRAAAPLFPCPPLALTRSPPLTPPRFSFLVLLGQLTFASGTSASSLHIMLIGRAIFGLGGESISVAQSSVTAEWFRGKELALASGITLSVSRLGSGAHRFIAPVPLPPLRTFCLQLRSAHSSSSPAHCPRCRAVVNNSLSPAIARAVSLPAAVWFGALLCLSSFCSSLVLGAVDRRATKQLRTEERRRQVPPPCYSIHAVLCRRPVPPRAHPYCLLAVGLAGGGFAQGRGHAKVRAAFISAGRAGQCQERGGARGG